MKLTYAKSKDDLEEIADLRGKVYARRSYFEFYAERKKYQNEDPWYRPEHSRIIKENGKIVSHVSIIQKPVRFKPVVIKMAGIGDVFTVPEYRGKGYSRILMNDALQFMKKNKYSLTMLYGIPDYYHKFGYIEAVKDYKLYLPIENINGQNLPYNSREWQENDIPKMLELYKTNSQSCILTVDRNLSYLKRIISDPKRIVLITDNTNEIVGYAHLIDEITKQFVVNEAITSNYEISKKLALEILKKVPKNTFNIEVRMSPDMPFIKHLQHLGAELRMKTHAEGDGNAMLAIIDLYQLMIELIPLFDQRLQSSEFYNSDPKLIIATEKEKMEIFIKKGTIQKILKINPNIQPTLVVKHRYFVRNIIGYWTIRELFDLTEADVTNEQSLRLLDVLFPKEEPFMLPLDYF